MKTIFYLIITIGILSLSSCRSYVYKKSFKVYSYKLGTKEIRYIPIHHLGRPIFYEKVKNDVIKYKNDGYVVFYELIDFDSSVDSLTKDTVYRKDRKLSGNSLNYDEVQEILEVHKDIMRQPNYKDMGVTDSDIRADANFEDYISEVERLCGEIILDNNDYATPLLDNSYKPTTKYLCSHEKIQRVTIDYRNNHLINLIKNSDSNKILILYGSGHRIDLEKRIKMAQKN